MAAPSALQFYAKNINALKLTDLASVNIRLLLTTSVYTPSTIVTGHSVLADITRGKRIACSAGCWHSAGKRSAARGVSVTVCQLIGNVCQYRVPSNDGARRVGTCRKQQANIDRCEVG